MARHDRSAWLTTLSEAETTHAVLVAFTHAGGSATSYRDWRLPPHVELRAVQYPGRGPRRNDAFAPSLAALCDAVGADAPPMFAKVP